METGASTPEELESLLEDALVMGDHEAVAQLFERNALLVTGNGAIELRGDGIGRHATALRDQGYRYVSDPQLILQAHNTTLVVAQRAVNVMRRRGDGRWRYAISLLRA
jgi:hypothetical protein